MTINQLKVISGVPQSTHAFVLKNALNTVMEVALEAIETTKTFMGSISRSLAESNLSITALRYGFYGVRIPFIYLEYFVHDAMHDSIVAIAGNILYLFGELGNFAKWLSHLNLIDLTNLSAALGKVPVLGSLGVCPIDAGLGLVSGAASVLYAIDYVMQLATGNLTDSQEVAIAFGLSASLVHILAIIIFFSSGGTLFGLTVCLTLASVVLYMIYWGLKDSPSNKKIN